MRIHFGSVTRRDTGVPMGEAHGGYEPPTQSEPFDVRCNLLHKRLLKRLQWNPAQLQ